MQKFVVKKQDANQTVVKYLNRLLPNAPQGLIYKQIRKKNITLNEKKISGNEKLKENDVLFIFMSDETISKFSEQNKKDISEYQKAYSVFKNPNIVYEDDHIIILNKPVGMLSQKGDGGDLSANEWLVGYMLNKKETDEFKLSSFTPSICNRLDRNTGGLLLFGKTLFGTTTLNNLLKERNCHKYYRTIVHGKMSDSIEADAYLKKDESTNKVTLSDSKKDGYDRIITSYTPVRYNAELNITEVEVLLVTGKPHQIRAHLAFLGYPILGDSKYGEKTVNDFYKSSYRLNNQILYAYKFVFPELEDYKEVSGKTFIADFNNIFEKFF